jgi:hypothetical protein
MTNVGIFVMVVFKQVVDANAPIKGERKRVQPTPFVGDF